MALTYMFNQVEGGVMCPMAMTYSVIPALKHNPDLEAQWLPKVLSDQYDDRDIPIDQKLGGTIAVSYTHLRAHETSLKKQGLAWNLKGLEEIYGYEPGSHGLNLIGLVN